MFELVDPFRVVSEQRFASFHGLKPVAIQGTPLWGAASRAPKRLTVSSPGFQPRACRRQSRRMR
jgi:hypothetical protein